MAVAVSEAQPLIVLNQSVWAWVGGGGLYAGMGVGGGIYGAGSVGVVGGVGVGVGVGM